MKYSILIIVTLLSIISCSKPSELQKTFNCKTQHISNTQEITDFQKKFTISIPKHWKKSFYYDTVQTQIQVADTLKQLTDTYLLIASLNSGELNINDTFKNKVLKGLEQETYENTKYKFVQFKNKPSIWFLAKGKKLDKTYHLFQLFIKNSPTDYYEITSQFFGDDLVDERLCESIAILEKIKFLN